LPHLLKSKGSVVGISSTAGKKGLPGRTGYSASKFAMEGFLESLRIENLKKDLHVLVACPGFTASNIRQSSLTKDGKSQAKNFIEEVKLEPGDLPPVLDIEQLNGVPAITLKKEVKEWLDAIELYYGVKPIIYTNVEFYRQYLGSEFDPYLLWAAHYYEYNQPRIKRGWSFWQHSDGGRVNGILSKVDFNVFNGDSTTFMELLVD